MVRKKKKKEEKEKGCKSGVRIIRIYNREYEILNENRFSARIFEAILARGAIIMDALDKAKIRGFERGKMSKPVKERPIYKHTILLGKDDNGHNLRASISVFENSVIVQTLREI